MRVLSPVVLAQTLLMARSQAQLASCRAVGAQLVGDELVWSEALLPEQFAHEPQSSRCVPLGLDQQIQDLALAVDSPPQVHTSALDRDHHLVQVPLPGRSGSQSTQVPGEHGTELRDPASDRLVGGLDAALSQEFLNV